MGGMRNFEQKYENVHGRFWLMIRKNEFITGKSTIIVTPNLVLRREETLNKRIMLIELQNFILKISGVIKNLWIFQIGRRLSHKLFVP